LDKQSSPADRLDWLLFGLRWLIVAAGLLLLALPRLTPATPNNALMIVIGVIIAYNVGLAILYIIGIKNNILRLVTLIADMIVAVVVYYASGSVAPLLIGAGLLPVAVGALRFGMFQGIGVAIATGLSALLVALITGALQMHLTDIAFAAIFWALIAGLVGYTRPDGDFWNAAMGQLDDRKSLQSGQERARALYEMAATLGATLDYQKVLDAALDVGVLGLKEMGPDTRLISMVMLFEGDELRVVTSRRLTRQDNTKRAAGKNGILEQALRTAEPVFAGNPANDPELKYFAAFQDAQSILAIPLRAGYSNYGIIVFGALNAHAFSDEQIDLMTAVGSQATVALQNASLYQNLVKEKERIVEVEEDARKKLARDLHDGPTQGIAAIAMRVSYIKRLVDNKPGEALEELGKVEELARKTTKEIRHMLFTLRPLILETQGLTPALKQFAEKMKDTHNLNVTVQSQQGADDLLESHAQGVLFYIVEEAVGNARKHAQADNIFVRLYRRDKMFAIEIQDDGVGFDLDSVTSNYEQRGSLGMVNMRERAALVEGLLKVESAPGKGTKISVLVPIKQNLNPQATGSNAPRQPQMNNTSGR
jgi:signal transduction histidine kinase